MSVTGRLVFNPTDANSIAASSSVGAYLRASDGTLLTHTDVGGKKALDVRVAEGINVEVDLDAADDSVAAWLSDGAGNALSSTAGALHISDGAGSLTVDAVDLDIRDLDSATDSVASWLSDGAGNAIGSTAGALDVNIASGTLSVTVNDVTLANVAIENTATAVSTTAINIVASALANRKYLMLANEGNKSLYWGKSGITTSNGFPLHPGMQVESRVGPSVAPQVIGGTGASSESLRVMELS